MRRMKPYHWAVLVNAVAGLVGCVLGDAFAYAHGFLNPVGILLGLLIMASWVYWGVYVPALRRWERTQQ